jgi:tRNA(Met) cytidine acetyltransferase
MLDPLTEHGESLHERHARWFCRRLPGTLGDELSTLDPDVVRGVCRAIDVTPALDLTALEWRLVAGIPHGAATHATAPRAVRRLAFRHLVAPEPDTLSAREERLLVARALQCRPSETVAGDLSYRSARTCMRAFGDAVETLAVTYGSETARRELERLR